MFRSNRKAVKVVFFVF